MTVQKWVRVGYRIPFKQSPLLTRVPHPFHLPAWRERRRALRQAITSLLEKKAIFRVPHKDLGKPAFYSHLFLVPKKDGGFRPVLNVSRLNRYINCPHFQMETVRQVRHAVEPEDWSFSIDLTDAYLHVPIHPKSYKYLRLALSKEEVYCFRVLPFGLNTAPLVFTRVATAVAALLRTQGHRLHVYLDDWLILNQQRQILEESIPTILETLQDLGFKINQKKSRLTPSQQFEYLGLHFDTSGLRVRPADHLISKTVVMSTEFQSQSLVTPRALQVLLGVYNSIGDFIHLRRLFLRPIQHWLRNRWNQSLEDLDLFLVITPDLSQAVLTWTNWEWLLSGVPLRQPPNTITLCTDASLEGWGASVGSHMLAGRWSPQEAREHINCLEMRAIILGLSGHADRIRACAVLLLCDNTTCVSYIRKYGGTHSVVLCKLTCKICQIMEDLQVSLTCRHIPSKQNVLADALSRTRPLQTEWKLHRAVFLRLQGMMPNPSVDLFATCVNKQLECYVSPFPDHLSIGTEALSIPWRFQGIPYAFRHRSLFRRFSQK
jgi:hypothetical protein